MTYRNVSAYEVLNSLHGFQSTMAKADALAEKILEREDTLSDEEARAMISMLKDILRSNTRLVKEVILPIVDATLDSQ